MSDWSQLLDEVAELEVPATLRGRVFAGAQAGPPPPPHRRVRRAVLIAAAAVGIACVITALVVAAHSRRDLAPPAKSEPGLSALAAADHRVAVAYRDFLLAQRACRLKEATTEADIPGCVAAASELENQIQALRRVVVAIGNAGSDACKKSAAAYDFPLWYRWWNVSTLRNELLDGDYAGYRRYVFILNYNRSSLHVGPIDACL